MKSSGNLMHYVCREGGWEGGKVWELGAGRGGGGGGRPGGGGG